jgi:GNAT superfamily N-acetyltransferase
MSDEPGFLVEGFETAPAVLMSHCPPYYAEFAGRYGFVPGPDSLAYQIDLTQYDSDLANVPAVVHRIAERARARHGSHAVRRARAEEWDTEVMRLHPVYNRSLSVLQDFTPMQLAEFQEQAEGLRPLLDPDLVLIAEMDGQVVGFALGLPNINEALRHANGLRYPWDYIRLALARRRITGASFKILAMDPDYWGYGLEAIMYLEMGRAVKDKGYTWLDASLTGAENPQTNRIAQRFGACVYRRYREYSLTL